MTNDTLDFNHRIYSVCMADMEHRGLHNREVKKFWVEGIDGPTHGENHLIGGFFVPILIFILQGGRNKIYHNRCNHNQFNIVLLDWKTNKNY